MFSASVRRRSTPRHSNQLQRTHTPRVAPPLPRLSNSNRTAIADTICLLPSFRTSLLWSCQFVHTMDEVTRPEQGWGCLPYPPQTRSPPTLHRSAGDCRYRPPPPSSPPCFPPRPTTRSHLRRRHSPGGGFRRTRTVGPLIGDFRGHSRALSSHRRTRDPCRGASGSAGAES